MKYKNLIFEKINDQYVLNLVMELVEGKNMSQYIQGVGPPKLSQLPYVKDIGQQILSGV